MKSIRSHILKAVTAVIALVMTTGSLAACRQEKKDYATGYPIEVKKHDRNVLDKWDIWKRQEKGVTFLQISCRGEKEEPMDDLLFWVYDTPEEAKYAYDNYYESTKKYTSGKYWQEDKNWFIGEEPGVCDATVIWMVCLEDNVIITGDIDVWSAWSENVSDGVQTDPPADDPGDSELKEYVIKNSSKIKEYVINKILEG